MYTWQDFENNRNDISKAIQTLINDNRNSDLVRVARAANLYDAQLNETICNFVRMVYTRNGRVPDEYSANHRICSNFFRHLNKQRVAYSLGNGVTFNIDGLKERLGSDFDTRINRAAYLALIHGVSFVFWNIDHIHVFPITEFAPLWDEETGILRGGVRYWQLNSKKPVHAVLYEEDGFTRFRADYNGAAFKVVEDKRAYRMDIRQAAVDAEPEIVGEENYGVLPIVPFYGSNLQQSTLVGMRGAIDAYDLVRSGFANDLSDCSEIYWIVTNAGGMDEVDLARFRNRLKHEHIANVEDADGVTVTPYTQEIPYNARKAFLDDIRSGIYEDFGGLDVHAMAAGATNDHIEAAYQPLDDAADDFEYQTIECIQGILRIIGVDDVPSFKRNRISNETERTNMVLAASTYLDDETVLNKLPFISPDEIADILDKRSKEDYRAFEDDQPKEVVTVEE